MEYREWDFDPRKAGDGVRELGLFDPCPCGCVNRGRANKVKGYLSAEQPPFGGFSIIAETDDEWRLLQRVALVIGARRVLARTPEEYFGFDPNSP